MGCDGVGGGGANPLMQRRSSILVRFAVTHVSNSTSNNSEEGQGRSLTSMATLLTLSSTCLCHAAQSRVDGSAIVVGFGGGSFWCQGLRWVTWVATRVAGWI